MPTITTTFKNFKKHADFTHDFKSGNLYFVQGQNSQGKTSIIDGIIAPLTAQDKTKVPLSWGTEEGQIINKIKGADGKEWLVRYDYNKAGKQKFVLFSIDDGTSTGKIGEIRNVFQYNSHTVEELLVMSDTAAGRIKLRDIILDMLPVEARKQFYEQQTNETTAYDKRANANKLLGEQKLLLEHSSITDEEIEILKNEDLYIEGIEEAKKVLATNNLINEKVKRKSELKDGIEAKIKEGQELRTTAAENHKEYTTEIDRLKAELIKYEKKITDNTENYNTKSATIQEAIETLTNEFGELPTEAIDVTKLEAEIKEKDDIITDIGNIKTKQLAETNLQNNVDKYQKQYDIQDSNVKEARIKKEKVIVDSKLPIDNIVVQDEGISVIEGKNLIPFNTTDLSYSTAGFIAAQIILFINKKLPLLLLGRAESYDKSKFDALLQLAKDNDAIIIGDRVTVEGGLEIVCYQE